MSDRQVVLWTSQLPTISEEPLDEPSDALATKWKVPDDIEIVDLDEQALVPMPYAQDDVVPMPSAPDDVVPIPHVVPNISVPPQTSNAARFIVIRPAYTALDLTVAYSHLLNPGESPEFLMQDLEQGTFEHFVLAAEVGLKHEGDEAKTLQEAIYEAGHGGWLSEEDVTTVLKWTISRANEMDADMGHSVPLGYCGLVLNQAQLNREPHIADDGEMQVDLQMDQPATEQAATNQLAAAQPRANDGTTVLGCDEPAGQQGHQQRGSPDLGSHMIEEPNIGALKLDEPFVHNPTGESKDDAILLESDSDMEVDHDVGRELTLPTTPKRRRAHSSRAMEEESPTKKPRLGERQPFLANDSDDDLGDVQVSFHSPDRGRRSQAMQGSPSKVSKPTVQLFMGSDEDESGDDYVYVPDQTPSRSPSVAAFSMPTAGPSRFTAKQRASGSSQQVGSSSSAARANRSASPARRTRWTAAQQFAMISCIYTAGYAGADWGSIAVKSTNSNPQGTEKKKSRARQAMGETHWINFLKNNNQGMFSPEQLTLNMPDMSGQAVSTSPSWTGRQKEILWAETFAFGESAVDWADVAKAVNDAAAGDATLHRKALDCQKTWKDTLRKHFGGQGRMR